MLNPKTLDDLARRLADAVPGGVKGLQGDMEKAWRANIQAALAKLDLVTREEFEVQSKVLARTRAKVDDLEQQVAELEARLLKDVPGLTIDNFSDSDSDGG
jgi:BMFP domain-containing protein YqiC